MAQWTVITPSLKRFFTQRPRKQLFFLYGPFCDGILDREAILWWRVRFMSTFKTFSCLLPSLFTLAFFFWANNFPRHETPNYFPLKLPLGSSIPHGSSLWSVLCETFRQQRKLFDLLLRNRTFHASVRNSTCRRHVPEKFFVKFQSTRIWQVPLFSHARFSVNKGIHWSMQILLSNIKHCASARVNGQSMQTLSFEVRYKIRI